MGSINIINGGLDVQSIVDALIESESAPIRRMRTQTSSLQNRISALQNFNSKLSSLLGKVDEILFSGESAPLSMPYSFDDRFADSVFSIRKAATSNESVLTATSSKGAASGSYSITVSELAQAKSMGSANFADTNTTRVGTGTLTLQVGTGQAVNITINDTNNTLDGVRRAINAANAGVTATVINDGSAQNPYRLLITSNTTGTANAFTITAGLSGGTALNMAQTAAAVDAQLAINGVTLTKSTNTISDVIQGMTLNLKAKSAAPVTITVTDDTDAMVAALKNLVSAYNDITSFIRSQIQYDSKTKQAGILSGDSTLRTVQMTMQGILSQGISNSFSSYRVLSQIGLSFNNDGTVSVDESKLRKALTENLKGTAALLLGNGTPADGVTTTDSRVAYYGKTAATKPGTYAVDVTTAPGQFSITGGQTVNSLSLDEVLTITMGGHQVDINLVAGTSLSNVLNAINNGLVANNISATAANDGTGRIKITASAYGSSQTIGVSSTGDGSAGTTGFSPSTSIVVPGVDVAGLINGHSAIASGNTLTGAAGQDEEGLSLIIGGSTAGSYGSATVAASTDGTEGASIIMNLRSALKNITDPLVGPIHSATDGLNNNITGLNDRIEAYQERLEQRRILLTREFSRADQALRLLNVTQNALNNQMSSLARLG